jgi:hypothetical protein
VNGREMDTGRLWVEQVRIDTRAGIALFFKNQSG